MTVQSAAAHINPNLVRKVLTVQAPQETAWRVFVEKFGKWWPLDTHKIGKAKAMDAIIEPGVGGRWYELGDDGSTCEWGRVLAWEPPARLLLSWKISADWQFDADLETEVDVRFIAEGAKATRIELEHRHLDRYGARRDQMRGIFDSEGGWTRLLEGYAQAANEAGAS